MSAIIFRTIHITLAVVYIIISLSAFVAILIVSMVTPAVIAYLCASYVSGEHLFSSRFGIYFSVAGLLASALPLIALTRTLRLGFGAEIIGHIGELTGSPQILTLVDEVVIDLGDKRFSGVYLSDDINISTFAAAGGRYLIIGRLPLQYLSTMEIKAVLAHECAHHHHGAMLLNRIQYRNVLLVATLRMASVLSMKYFNKGIFSIIPDAFMNWAILMWLPSLLGILVYGVFIKLLGVLAMNSEYEYYCDSIAAKHFSAKTLALALLKLRDLALTDALIKQGHVQGGAAQFDATFQQVRVGHLSSREKLSHMRSGTHPAIVERLSRLGLSEESLQVHLV